MNIESIHNMNIVQLFLLITMFSYHHSSPVSATLSIISYQKSLSGSINVNSVIAIRSIGTAIQIQSQVFTTIQLPKREL